MSGILLSMFGVFLGAVGQFALSIFPVPDIVWVTAPQRLDLPDRRYDRNQALRDQWKCAQKWGYALTFIGIAFTIFGLIL